MIREIDPKAFDAILGSITQQELEHPGLILTQGSRVRRVALGSGRSPTEVRRFAKAFAAFDWSRSDTTPDALFEEKRRGY